uniref:Uncharacterized protein AlNc14C78G5183 n=1 Tax=Albugo laibachii Nc14 TaxID=890382 RepID=F0WEY5_9STRA|nr:conserved hypothetical protein [Albugo laibachii Nc14]|eukprot:CCA19767.1 conserved hypothetical protein [Albugo laibachii Nc14]
MTTATRTRKTRARCCQVPCQKFAQSKGLCKAHGGGSRCRHEACGKLAQTRGLCIAHGGGRRCRCLGCKKLAQSKGFCIAHGGGRKCIVLDCNKFTQVKGRCKLHHKLLEQGTSAECSAEIPFKTPIHFIATSPNSVASNFCVVMPMILPEQSFKNQDADKAQTHGKMHIDFLVNPMTTTRGATLPSISALHPSCGRFAGESMAPDHIHGRPKYQHEAQGHAYHSTCVLDSPFRTDSNHFLKALSLQTRHWDQEASEKRMQLPSLASLGMRNGCWPV